MSAEGRRNATTPAQLAAAIVGISVFLQESGAQAFQFPGTPTTSPCPDAPTTTPCRTAQSETAARAPGTTQAMPRWVPTALTTPPSRTTTTPGTPQAQLAEIWDDAADTVDKQRRPGGEALSTTTVYAAPVTQPAVSTTVYAAPVTRPAFAVDKAFYSGAMAGIVTGSMAAGIAARGASDEAMSARLDNVTALAALAARESVAEQVDRARGRARPPSGLRGSLDDWLPSMLAGCLAGFCPLCLCLGVGCLLLVRKGKKLRGRALRKAELQEAEEEPIMVDETGAPAILVTPPPVFQAVSPPIVVEEMPMTYTMGTPLASGRQLSQQLGIILTDGFSQYSRVAATP